MKTMQTNEGEIPQYDLPNLPTTIDTIYRLGQSDEENDQAVLRIIKRLIVAHSNCLTTVQEVRGTLCTMSFSQAIENVIHLYTADKFTLRAVTWHDVINKLLPNDNFWGCGNHD